MDSSLSLYPNVDRRFAEWMYRQELLKKRLEPQVRPTICISRRYGCEAYPLAELLEERLEAITEESWTLFDKTLIEKVSGDHDLSKKLLDNLDLEPTPSSAYEFFASIFSRNWQPAHIEAYELLTQYILRIAKDGNAIIVGRGAEIVTQGQSSCFHFRLDASFDWRVQSIATRLGLTVEEATAEVEANQIAREKFIETYLKSELGRVELYHMLFNNEKVPVPLIADAIIKIVAASGLLKNSDKITEAA